MSESYYYANSILDKSFEHKKYLNPAQLQRILYICDSEYRKVTGNKVVSEPWATFAYGPSLYSIYSQIECLGNKPVKKFLKNINNEWYKSDKVGFDYIVDRCFFRLCDLSVRELADLTRHPDEAWDDAYQNNKKFLDDEKIGLDKFYQKIFIT